MALSNILQTIEEDTQKQVDELKEKGEQQKQELRKELDAESEKKKQQLLNTFELRAQKKLAQASWEFSSRTQTAVLKKKQQLLDNVFDTALKSLGEMSDKEYTDVVTALCKALPGLEEGAEVLPAKGKEKQTQSAVDAAGINAKVGSNTVESVGGFKVQGKEMNIDMTFEALVRAYRADHETEVASTLFK